MIEKDKLAKELQLMNEYTGSSFFSYDQLHNDTVSTEFHYDYKTVIETVAKNQSLSYDQAKKVLLDLDVLHPLPNDEYAVDVGATTRGGGGLNYSHGKAVFSYSDGDWQTNFHEEAHSLQHQLDLFNKDTLDDMYHHSSTPLTDKQKGWATSDTYKTYLKEMHSEAFSYMTLLFHSKSLGDFLKTSYDALARGASFTATAATEKNNRYDVPDPSDKFYSTYPVMKAVIKEAWKIRKDKKLQKELIDENGHIIPEKLARHCEKLVIKSAYTPRTFGALLNRNYIYFRKPTEHGWRSDTIKAKFFQETIKPVLKHFVPRNNSYGKTYKMHQELETDTLQKLQKIFMSPREIDSPHISAAYDIERLHAGMAKINIQGDFSRHTELLLRTILKKTQQTKDFSEAGAQRHAEICVSLLELPEASKNDLINFFKTSNEIITQNQDNPYFDKMMSYFNLSVERQKLFVEKLKDSPDDIDYNQSKESDTLSGLMRAKNAEETKLWLEAGADVNAKDNDGWTALMYPQSLEQMELLINASADVNDCDDWKGTALMYHANDLAKAKLLIEHGANINAEDVFNKSVLLHASNADVAELLLKLGADVNKTDYNGNSALTLATDPKHVEVLIRYGADVNYTDSSGKTLIMSDCSVEKMELLIKAGIDINATDNQGCTALMNYLTEDKRSQLNLLINAGADVNIQDNNGYSVLMYACNNEKLTDLLINAGADVNAKNKFGKTPLMLCQDEKSAELLIKAGADINYALENFGTQEEKDQLRLIVQKYNEKNEYLSSIRKKVAHKVDNILGTQLENVHLPQFIKDKERHLSVKLVETKDKRQEKKANSTDTTSENKQNTALDTQNKTTTSILLKGRKANETNSH